jgi:hypothetical protein
VCYVLEVMPSSKNNAVLTRLSAMPMCLFRLVSAMFFNIVLSSTMILKQLYILKIVVTLYLSNLAKIRNSRKS